MKLLWATVLIGSGSLVAQTQATDEVAALQRRVALQREQLRLQRQQIDELKAELVETGEHLKTWLAGRPAPVSSAAAPVPKPASPAPSGIHIPIFSGQEISSSVAGSPSLRLGPADVRILGYIGLSTIFRSASMGGAPGTSFASVPFPNTPAGNNTEFRATTQTSRLALRLDVPLRQDQLSAYVEADFSGATPGNALISSSSYGFRVRHAWIDYGSNKFEVAAGQMFSLLTPAKTDIRAWPGDALTTQAVDTNYVAGLVWDRSPSVRVVYRPNKKWSVAASIENPEQQVGSVVKFPAALASVLASQYNTGTGELKTPNIAGDTIVKVAWNSTIGGHNVHIDAGSVFRFFRNYDPAGITRHKSALGIGGNVNVAVDLTKKLRLITLGYLSSGGGRYIGGLLPDVIVRANGDISPVKAHSWVGGLEWATTRRINTFAYYSGVYGAQNTTTDTDGSLIGFGYAGSSAARRLVQEWTGGWAQTLWSGEDRGSVQYAAQYSYLTNNPWWQAAGARPGHVHMIFSQIRYNLP
jgi:hypothetical protein